MALNTIGNGFGFLFLFLMIWHCTVADECPDNPDRVSNRYKVYLGLAGTFNEQKSKCPEGTELATFETQEELDTLALAAARSTFQIQVLWDCGSIRPYS